MASACLRNRHYFSFKVVMQHQLCQGQLHLPMLNLGVGPRNYSCEPCVQFFKFSTRYYNLQYNSTSNKAELIWGFRNTLENL